MPEKLSQKIAELQARQARLEATLSRYVAANAELSEDLRSLRQEIESGDISEAQKIIEVAEPESLSEKLTPPPLPASLAPITEPVAAKIPDLALAEPPPLAKIEAAETVDFPAPAVAKNKEWELDFGRVWLVRLGMVMLLTGLVFLSTYAYQNWLFKTGPAAKVSFFMVISLAISGLGIFLEKRVARLSQYGQVLIAGGLGAGYYTLYAAHFVPTLKIIDSQIVSGLILSLWAGMMLWVAVRKKSELVAVMSLGLAFYGTVVNPASGLALFSSLLLSAAGMWLLLRNRWLSLGMSTLLAAYGAQAYWWGLYPAEVAEVTRLAYPLCYWLLFVTFLALPQARALPTAMLRALGGLNNGAAWALLVFSRPGFLPHENFEWISMGAGAVMLVLAAMMRRNLVWPRSLGSIFGGQGVFFLTVGILVAATGYERFLILAAEACVLLWVARFFGATWLRIFSGVVFGLALLYAVPEPTAAMASWKIYLSFTLLSALYTILIRREVGEAGRVFALLSAGVTWVIWYFGVLDQWSLDAATLALCVSLIAVVALAIWVKKAWFLVDLAGAASLAALASGLRFLYFASGFSGSFIVLSLVTIGFFWWLSPRLRTVIPDESEGRQGALMMEWVFAVLLCLSLGRALNVQPESTKAWLLLGGFFALAGGAIGEFLKRRSLVVTALFFYPVVFVSEHLGSLSAGAHGLAFLPVIYVLAHFVLADSRWKLPGRKVAHFYLAPATLLLAWLPFFENWARPELGYLALGLFFSGWALWRNGRELAFVCGFGTLALTCFWTFGEYGWEDWPRYLTVFSVLAFHAVLWLFFRDKKEWNVLRVLFFGLGISFLLLTTSVHVYVRFDGNGLTVTWAILSGMLFALGLLMSCRPYRLTALAVMIGAVGNVMLVDVMRLGSLGRILSFLTLGVILLALGFLYNRYQDQIRKFL